MSKMNRELELREKRELKQEKKDQKKLAAAAAAEIDAEAPTPARELAEVTPAGGNDEQHPADREG